MQLLTLALDWLREWAYLCICQYILVLFCGNLVVLGEWTNIAAANGTTTIRVVPSPTVSTNGSSISNATSRHMMTTPSHNMTSVTPHNTTVTPHNTTVTPSHNKTIMPHSTVMPPHNMTITPSSAHTVMPTSSAHPTPTPTPTPAPKPGNFSVKENGTVCLFAYMAAQFDIMIVSKVCGIVIISCNLWAFMFRVCPSKY